MTSPLWKYPGSTEGRILPVNSVPQDAAGGGTYGYSSTYYYGYYTEAVYCLGEDISAFQSYRFQSNNIVRVEQTFTISAAHKLIRFSWHMRTPDMPQSRNIVVAGPVDFIGQQLATPYGALDGGAPAGLGLITSGDSCTGVRIPSTADASVQSLFAPTDREQYLLVSGATAAGNNGFHRISAVPWNQGSITNGACALTEYPSQLSITQQLADPAVTLRIYGCKWTGRAYYKVGAGAWTEYFSLIEEYGHTWYRSNLAFNVSKYTGAFSIRFEAKLERLAA